MRAFIFTLLLFIGFLGFSQINKVIQGKLIEIDIDSSNEVNAKKIIEDASEKLLANLVIEDYEITILKGE